MKIQFALLSLVSLLSVTSFASRTGCVSLGRTAADSACYGYTEKIQCESKTDRASCIWLGPVTSDERGTGPIRVECNLNGETKIVNANEVYFSQNYNTLTAKGFGPNRQDDGIARLDGECQISVRK